MNRPTTCRNDEDGAETGEGVVPRDEGWGEPAEHPTGVRHIGGVNMDQASMRNVRTCRPDAKGAAQVVHTTRARVPMRGTGAEVSVVGLKVL